MEITMSKKSCYDHGIVPTNSEKGLSCQGWLSTKYSQLGSTRPWPPNSLASEFKATLYLSSTVKLQSSEKTLSQFTMRETSLSSLTPKALSKSQSWPDGSFSSKINWPFLRVFAKKAINPIPIIQELDWFGWIVLIKSKILITAGMVWPASSDKWKALSACVAGVSQQNKCTRGGRGERDKRDEERSGKKKE